MATYTADQLINKYQLPSTSTVSVSPPKREPGYFDSVGAQYKKAAGDITTGVKQGAQALDNNDSSLLGEFKTTGSLLRTALRTSGGVAGAAFAPITEAPVIKQALGGVGSLISKIPGVEDVVNNASELAKRHPELAKDIQNIVDIATLGSAVPTTNPGLLTQGIEKTGKALQEGAIGATERQKSDFIRKLLTPEQTKAVKEAQVSRTSETGKGIFKRSIVDPTPAQIRSERAVASIPEIDPKATVQQNYNVIRKANEQEAQRLETAIKENDFVIPRKEIASRLQEAKANLAKSPTIVGDAQKTAQRLLNGAQEFINNNPGTGSGLLQARKDFDAWVKSQKPNAFDAASENAFTIANREIRTTFNNLLDEKAPSVGVKDSLSHQSSLYNAMDVLEPKAAQEADTAIGRKMEKIGRALGIKNKAVQAVATVAGIGGLGAAATFAPIIAGVGIPLYLTYEGGKLILKPQVRKAIGQLLEKQGHLLDKTDRALLEGILKQYEE